MYAVGLLFGGTTGDRYELLAPLGSGSFGTTWRARDHDEDTEVAVKLLDPLVQPDDVLREARLHRRLSTHPRVVAMRNVELGANPSSFVVMDLIEGGSIQDVLDARSPTIVEAHRWLRDTLEAIAHAHAADSNVLHRDIKPSNLLLGPDGHAMLTDFGVSEDSVRRASTTPGMYPLTTPPEFAAGGVTTEASDLWLVGVLGYQLLTGRRPDLARAHAGNLELPHRYSPEVPIALSRRVMSALEVQPASRPASAERMLDQIASIPVHAGWRAVSSADVAVIRCWVADPAGGGVTVQIRRRARQGDYEVTARAPAGERLRGQRRVVCPSEAAAVQAARAWLTHVVAGKRL